MCKNPVVETAHLISTLEQLYSLHYNQASVVTINTDSKQHVCVANISTGVLYSCTSQNATSAEFLVVQVHPRVFVYDWDPLVSCVKR